MGGCLGEWNGGGCNVGVSWHAMPRSVTPRSAFDTEVPPRCLPQCLLLWHNECFNGCTTHVSLDILLVGSEFQWRRGGRIVFATAWWGLRNGLNPWERLSVRLCSRRPKAIRAAGELANRRCKSFGSVLENSKIALLPPSMVLHCIAKPPNFHLWSSGLSDCVSLALCAFAQ